MSFVDHSIDHYILEAEPGRKGEILEAAVDVFEREGYDGGSVREIAAKVGVRESALYRHFSGKEAILETLTHVVCSRAREETLQLIAEIDGTGVRTSLLTAFRNRYNSKALYGPLLRVVLPSAYRNPALARQLREEILDPATEQVYAKVAEIDAIHGVPDASRTRIARLRAGISLVIGYVISAVALDDEQDEIMVDMCLHVMGWEKGGSR